jgi:hypothetical protein
MDQFPVTYGTVAKLEGLFKKDKTKLGKLTLPLPGQLIKEAKAMPASDDKKAALYFLLETMDRSIKLGVTEMDEIKSSIRNGANISNYNSIRPMEFALECLEFYTDERAVIVPYIVKEMVKTDDDIWVIGKAMSGSLYRCSFLSHIKSDTMKAISKQIYELDIKGPGKSVHKKFLVAWGIIKKDQLPKEEQLKVPKKLPSNSKELQEFYKALGLKDELKFQRGAKSVPDTWPEDIREIFLTYNGSDKVEFEPMSRHSSIRTSIKWTMKSFEGDDDFEPEGGMQIDLRKHIHADIIPIGGDGSGDDFFADPHTKSITGQSIIIRACHDESWTGYLAANSLAEYLGRLCISQYEDSFGPDEDLEKLEKTKVGIAKKGKKK